MASHVSMMDDVLIAQLPTSMVRAALRHLVASCPRGSPLLSENVKKQFVEQNAPLPSPQSLYPSDLDSGNSQTLDKFVALTRCLFSCHAVHECLAYLTHLFESVPPSQLQWTKESKAFKILGNISGDAVQAIQSVKEATPTSGRTPELLQDLRKLVTSLEAVAKYCKQQQLPFPFGRAALSAVDALELLFPNEGSVDRSIFDKAAMQIDLAADQVNGVDIEQVALGKLSVPRLFNGLWQMSSATAWGSASADKLDDHLLELVQCGFTTTDMADHYGDAELVYGSFRNRLPSTIQGRVLAATKWCVFKPLNEPVTRELVLRAVKERCKRLGGRADLFQFHWQDHSNHEYLNAVQYLVELTETRPDLLTEVGLVNFNAEDTETVCKYMIEQTGKVGIVANQVQFSLIDSRPLFGLCQVCEKYGVKLLTYGSYCGGFLSDKWLDKPSPDPYDPSSKLTPSQRKYFDSINEWGSWAEFQKLLHKLRAIGDKKNVSISNVAARWVLEQPAVGSVIVGTRLGVSSNAEQNLDTFSLALSQSDMESIDEVASVERGRAFYDKIGDCGAEYH